MVHKSPQQTSSKKSETSIELTIGNSSYKSKGSSIHEAMEKIKPRDYRGIARISITKDGKTSVLPIRIVPTKLQLVFSKPFEMAILCKRMETLI